MILVNGTLERIGNWLGLVNEVYDLGTPLFDCKLGRENKHKRFCLEIIEYSSSWNFESCHFKPILKAGTG